MAERKMKFVIVSPCQRSGGGLVLHQLCRLLQKQGHEAKIFELNCYLGKYSSSGIIFYLKYFLSVMRDMYRTVFAHMFPNTKKGRRWHDGYVYKSVKGCKKKWLPWVDKDTIVIYPEIYRGNMLHAAKVVRWLLYYNRYPNDADWYAKDDLFVAYRMQFNDKRLNPRCVLLHVFSFDTELYKRTNYGERKGNCYIVRKGISRADLPQHFDGPVIDGYSEKEKVDILNQCARCYSYDTQTFYTSIAAICGCLPIVVTEAGKTRKDYLTSNEQVLGVAYGDSQEEIEFALATQNNVLEHIQKELAKNEINAAKFVLECRKHFSYSDGA